MVDFDGVIKLSRNLLGEDLGPLSSKELENLERQLDMSLKQIRSTRVNIFLLTSKLLLLLQFLLCPFSHSILSVSFQTQYMLDQLTDLQRKVRTK